MTHKKITHFNHSHALHLQIHGQTETTVQPLPKFFLIIFQSFKADICGNPVALFSSNLFLHFALGVLVLLRTEATLRLLLIK